MEHKVEHKVEKLPLKSPLELVSSLTTIAKQNFGSYHFKKERKR